MNFTKELLISRAWGFGSEATDNNVEAYISFLRKKLRYLDPHVFGRFYRSDKSRSTPQGYALAITKEMVEKLNGKITAQSTVGYGIYSIFHLRKIPAYAGIFK